MTVRIWSYTDRIWSSSLIIYEHWQCSYMNILHAHIWAFGTFVYDHMCVSYVNINYVHIWSWTMFTYECSYTNIFWTIIYVFVYECSHMSSAKMFICEQGEYSHMSAHIWDHIQTLDCSYVSTHMWTIYMTAHMWLLICDCSYVTTHTWLLITMLLYVYGLLLYTCRGYWSRLPLLFIS